VVSDDVDQMIAAVRAMAGAPGAAVYAVEGSQVTCLRTVGIAAAGRDAAEGAAEGLVRNVTGMDRTVPECGRVVVPVKQDGHLVAVVVAVWPGHDAPDGAQALLLAVARLWTSAHDDRDFLTGLVARRVLLDHLRLANLAAARSDEVPVLLFCDVDGLKKVNDRYGHAVGDQVLRGLARRITDIVRPADTVARLGGDEFVVLCPSVTDVAEASVIARRLHGVLAADYVIGSTVVSASASIGVAVGPFADPEEGLHQADVAMYAAKQQGCGYALFDSGLAAADRWSVHVRSAFPAAAARGQLCLQYQPQYRLVSGRVTTVEALLRWRHPERGLLGPDQFLSLIEGAHDIADALAAWVLATACHEAATWAHRLIGWSAVRLAVNVSPRQLARGRLTALVTEALRESGLAPERLQLEVTETSLLADPTDAGRQLRNLRELGITVALDDFGVGYSSLALLRDLPVDVLKIDRSFTRDMLTDPRAEAIVAAVIRLGHHLQARVCAEGVETAAQVQALRKAGCDDVQGFLLYPPVFGPELPRQPWTTMSTFTDARGAATGDRRPQRTPGAPGSSSRPSTRSSSRNR
jgi:diguanylate cyclase (GGDEF)-like protein